MSSAVLIKEQSYKTFLGLFEKLENSTLQTDVIGLYIFSFSLLRVLCLLFPVCRIGNPSESNIF